MRIQLKTIILTAILIWQPLILFAESPQLKLQATLPKEVMPCHVFSVDLILENSGGDITIANPWGYDVQEPVVFLEIRTAKDNTLIYKGVSFISRLDASICVPPQVLKSGQHIACHVQLRCRWDNRELSGHLFTTAGQYKIRFSRWVPIGNFGENHGVRAESPWYDLTVVDVKPDEKEALNAVLAMSHPGLLFEPQEIDFISKAQQAKLKKELQQFLEQYPNSYWASFARKDLDRLNAIK